MTKQTKFDFFEIDINRLDEEWINQPKFYYKYAELLTDAKEEVERCKAQLEIANDDRKATRAKLDLMIRKKPKKYFGNNNKPSEAALTNRILVHPKYAEAQQAVYKVNEDLIKANKKVSTYYSAVFTLDHRKAALERLVSLHGQNYFSTPQAKDKNSKEVIDEMERKAARNKNKKRKRK